MIFLFIPFIVDDSRVEEAELFSIIGGTPPPRPLSLSSEFVFLPATPPLVHFHFHLNFSSYQQHLLLAHFHFHLKFSSYQRHLFRIHFHFHLNFSSSQGYPLLIHFHFHLNLSSYQGHVLIVHFHFHLNFSWIHQFKFQISLWSYFSSSAFAFYSLCQLLVVEFRELSSSA